MSNIPRTLLRLAAPLLLAAAALAGCGGDALKTPAGKAAFQRKSSEYLEPKPGEVPLVNPGN